MLQIVHVASLLAVALVLTRTDSHKGWIFSTNTPYKKGLVITRNLNMIKNPGDKRVSDQNKNMHHIYHPSNWCSRIHEALELFAMLGCDSAQVVVKPES